MMLRLMVLLLFLLPLRTLAQAAPPNHLVYEGVVGTRLNPLGATLAGEAGYRRDLAPGSQSVLLSDAFVGAFALGEITPSNWRVGAALVAEPLAVLRLRAAVARLGYFGTFDDLQSYPGPDADWSPEARASGGERGRNYRASGTLLSLGGRLQAKVGPVAVRDGLRFLRADMRLSPGDTTWYDSTLDHLLPGQGWAYVNEMDLLWVGERGLVLGVRHVTTGSFQSADAPAQVTSRMGPLVAYTFQGAGGPGFADPTLLVIANWWLSHPYRTGRSVSQAVPYLVVALAFHGDLTPAW